MTARQCDASPGQQSPPGVPREVLLRVSYTDGQAPTAPVRPGSEEPPIPRRRPKAQARSREPHSRWRTSWVEQGVGIGDRHHRIRAPPPRRPDRPSRPVRPQTSKSEATFPP
eukprot:3368437-Alexandrium_andersonii.AAC.1